MENTLELPLIHGVPLSWYEIEKQYESYAEKHAKKCPFCGRTPKIYACNYYPERISPTEPGEWCVVMRCRCIWNPIWFYKAKTNEELKENIEKLVKEWNDRPK